MVYLSLESQDFISNVDVTTFNDIRVFEFVRTPPDTSTPPFLIYAY